jgi:hypothetical protein
MENKVTTRTNVFADLAFFTLNIKKWDKSHSIGMSIHPTS